MGRKASWYPWLFTSIFTSVLSFCAGFSLHYALSRDPSENTLGIGAAEVEAPFEVASIPKPIAPDPSAIKITKEETPDVWAARHLFVAVDGQWLSASTKELMAELRPGGVILRDSNTRNAVQTLSLVRELKEAVHVGNQQFTDLPLVAVHHTHFANRGSDNTFALGQGGTSGNALALGRQYGAEANESGINIVWGPALDLDDGKSVFPSLASESYGADREAVTSLGLSVAQGFIEEGILPVIKYFPGYGQARFASDGFRYTMEGDVAGLAEAMYPFREAINGGARGILVGHIAVPMLDEDDPERPAVFSEILLETVLRKRWEFGGVIVADDLSAPSIARNFSPEEATVAALAAGCDAVILMESDPETLRRVCDAIQMAVADGRISKSQLAASAARLDDWQTWLRSPVSLDTRQDFDSVSAPDTLRMTELLDTPEESVAEEAVLEILPEATETQPFNLANIEAEAISLDEIVEQPAPPAPIPSEPSPEEVSWIRPTLESPETVEQEESKTQDELTLEIEPEEESSSSLASEEDSTSTLDGDEEGAEGEPIPEEPSEEDDVSLQPEEQEDFLAGLAEMLLAKDIDTPDAETSTDEASTPTPEPEPTEEVPVEGDDPIAEDTVEREGNSEEPETDSETKEEAFLVALELPQEDLNKSTSEPLDEEEVSVPEEETAPEETQPDVVTEVEEPESPEPEIASTESELVEVEHTVDPGETLMKIARKYDVRPSEIMEWNNLTSLEPEYGAKLTIRVTPEEAEEFVTPEKTEKAFEYKQVEYRVQAGDTLLAIARKHKIRLEELIRWNSLKTHHIRSGMKLKLYLLPEGVEVDDAVQRFTTYTVRSGDTLSTIAAKFGVSKATIQVLNEISNPNHVRLGQRLKVPL